MFLLLPSELLAMIPAPLLDLPNCQAEVFADFDFGSVVPYRAYFEHSEEILDLVRLLLFLRPYPYCRLLKYFCSILNRVISRFTWDSVRYCFPGTVSASCSFWNPRTDAFSLLTVSYTGSMRVTAKSSLYLPSHSSGYWTRSSIRSAYLRTWWFASFHQGNSSLHQAQYCSALGNWQFCVSASILNAWW